MEDIVIDLYSLVFPSDYSLSLSPDPPSFLFPKHHLFSPPFSKTSTINNPYRL